MDIKEGVSQSMYQAWVCHIRMCITSLKSHYWFYLSNIFGYKYFCSETKLRVSPLGRGGTCTLELVSGRMVLVLGQSSLLSGHLVFQVKHKIEKLSPKGSLGLFRCMNLAVLHV